jgi:hypothetical protein
MRHRLLMLLLSALLTCVAAGQAPTAVFELEPYRKTVALRGRIAMTELLRVGARSQYKLAPVVALLWRRR